MNIPRALKILAVFFILTNGAGSSVVTAALLTSINRTDETEGLQLYFRFSELPEYDLKTYKRRIDIRFKETDTAKDVQPIKEDDRITRVLVRTTGDATTLSLFFRYPPQKITEKERKKPASLMIDILLGNQFSAMYPDLSTKLQGLTLLNRDAVDYTNPVNLSPYPGNWFSFFSEYEPPVSISPETGFTLPPFPMAQAAAGDYLLEEWLPELIREKAAGNQWQLTAQMLLEQVETEGEPFLRDLLLLSYAEALVRSGEYEKPHNLLQQIQHRYRDSLLAELAELLFTYVRLLHERDYLGYYDLKKLIDRIGPSTPFNAYFTILLAETAMDMGRFKEAEKHLSRDDIAFGGVAGQLRALRKADLLYLKNERIKALVAYLLLGERTELIHGKPASLARYADLLYLHKRYEKAEKAYGRLGALLAGKKQHGLALYRLAMSRRRAGSSPKKLQSALIQIQEAFPRTEAAHRAMMKEMDMDYLFKRADRNQAMAVYRNIANIAGTIYLREEAEFKQALVLLLDGAPLEAIGKCRSILREFQTGKLKVEARALIISELPKVVSELVEEKKYIEALVLAQQNRFLFSRGWIKNDFLYELARAYNELGFFDRSARTYQYLFDTSTSKEQEKIYLPLIESLYKDGQFAAIEDYADRFSFRYPASPHLPEIFFYRLNALFRSGESEKTAALLDSTERPDSDEIDKFAVSYYYEFERWDDVIEKITASGPPTGPGSDPDTMMMLAESYFQTGRLKDAAPLFEAVIDAGKESNTINEQALFRLAQLHLEKNETSQALKLLDQITEKGKAPLWKKLAEEEAALVRLQEKEW